MRVLLVSHGYPPDSVAGVERYTESVAVALRKDGDGVAVLTRRPGLVPRRPQLRHATDGTGVDVYRVVGGTMSPETFLAHDEQLERLATLALVGAAPDVVHVNHLVGIAPRLLAAARRLRVPTVITLHDYYFACPLLHLRKRSAELCAGPDGGRECAATCFAGDGLPHRWRLRAEYFAALLAYADRVTCPSARVAAYFERFAPDAAPIQVLPLGVAVRAYGESGASPDGGNARALRLAYLGIVTAQKGVGTIIEAVRLAGLPSTQLHVFGREQDEYADRLREQAARVPSLHLEIAGEYRPEEVPRLLQRIDAVVLPSRLPEVFPLAPREALASGVPVIVGQLGGLPDVVEEGTNGFTFDATRPDELASILRRLWEDPGALEQLRRGARETSVLSAADHVRQLRATYAEVVDESLRAWNEKAARSRELDALHTQLIDAGFAGAA